MSETDSYTGNVDDTASSRQPLQVQSLEALWEPSVRPGQQPPAPKASPAKAPAPKPPKEPGASRPKHKSAGRAKAPAVAKQKARKNLRTGTGVVLDGNISHKAVVKDGAVVSYRVFEGSSPVEALRSALDGTKGARVVPLGNLLIKTGVELPQQRAQRSVLAPVAAGTKAWPAADLAGVAVHRGSREAKDVVLAGLEGPIADGFWEALESHGAVACPMPFVLSEGAWFVVGRNAAWVASVSGGAPVAYKELKTGAGALSQAAGEAGAELSRFDKAGVPSGQATAEVYVAGVPSGKQTEDVLARSGLHVSQAPIDGVERWEIPVVEQGLALLAVRAATASLRPQGTFASPASLAKAAEAPAKRRRAVASVLVAAAAATIVSTGVVPMLHARQELSTAKAELRTASANEASVAKWTALRTQALAAKTTLRSLRVGNPSYAGALRLLLATAPPGTNLTSVVAEPPVATSSSGTSTQIVNGNGVDMTVQASIKSQTFASVATWERRLTAAGAVVQVSSESVLQKNVSVSMTVDIGNSQKGA